jgi:F-type H+-transporting ATPase subunit b
MRSLCGCMVLVAALLLAGHALAQEHHGSDRLEQAAETAAPESHHGPKLLDNWFSLSFGPGKERENGPFAFALLNFAVLVWLAVRFGGRPLAGFLQQRHRAVKRDLEEAAALHREAQQKLAQIEANVRDLDRQIAETKAAVAKDAEEERQRIIQNAEAEARRIVQQTEEILKRELRNAQRRLETEAVESAIRAAEKLVRQRLTEEDRQRLNEDYYKQLAS